MLRQFSASDALLTPGSSIAHWSGVRKYSRFAPGFLARPCREGRCRSCCVAGYICVDDHLFVDTRIDGRLAALHSAPRLSSPPCGGALSGSFQHDVGTQPTHAVGALAATNGLNQKAFDKDKQPGVAFMECLPFAV